MKLTVVADIIDAVFYNGKPQPSAKKLDVEDFFQFSLASCGAIIRNMYYEERELNNGDVTGFIASMVEVKEVPVKKGVLGQKVVGEDLLMLPKNLGIWNVYPVVKDGEGKSCDIDYESAFTRLQPGTNRLYDADDLGLNFFSQRGKKTILFCSDNCDIVAIEGIFSSDDFDVPENIARAIINDVLGTTLKVAGFPADPTDDNNPNIKLVNDKIASAQQ